MKKIITLLIILLLIQNNNINAQGATCATATPLAAGTYYSFGAITDAVAEITTPATTCSTAGSFQQEAWFSITTATATSLHVYFRDSATGNINFYIQFLTGTCGSPLTEVACGTGDTTSGTWGNASLANPSGTYYIRVVNTNSTSSFNIDLLSISITPISVAPVNDYPFSATLITSSTLCNALSGEVAAATWFFAYPACIGNPDDDVYYKFEAANTADTIKVVGSTGFDAVIEVLTLSGTQLNCTNATGIGSTETAVISGLTIGTSYYIRVYDFGTGTPTTSTFSICVTNEPPNTTCANAIPIAVTGSIAGNVGGSSSSSPALCGGNPDDNVWYSFVSPLHTAFVSATASAGLDIVEEVFSGTCGGTSIACANATGIGGSEFITLTGLTIGATYWVRVYDFGTGLPATTGFTISISDTIANTFCAGAIPVFCGGVYTGNTNAASTLGEPVICPSYSVSGIAKGVWYVFAGTGQTITASNCGGTTNYDTQLMVYSGTCGSRTCITGNDDVSGLCGLTATVRFCTAVGTDYYIYQTGYLGATGDFTLTITCDTALTNDNCPGTMLSVGPACSPSTASMSGVTTSGIPSCTGLTVSDVWFNFVAADTITTITIDSTSFNPVIETFSGICGIGSFGCHNTSNTGSETDTVSGLTVGNTYWFRVYDAYGASFIGGSASLDNFVVCAHVPLIITNIKEDIASSITIFPNPTTGEFKIESKYQVQSIKLYNVLGEVVWQNNFQNVTTATIDFTSNISSPSGRQGGAGIYFIEVLTQKGIVRRKFVKE